ncbi:FAD-dependent oxidoreductase [Chitinimonas sp. BJYL2]|uniref:FAD-dependent oxidoreductase n=1 Tax=Chitinimonas sp. BJYL2 TaxID=2976696 RepID=UPI0022B344B3|nr:FAD-dependent oxidoreductase [Chitinimonas sp. BJYL2]
MIELQTDIAVIGGSLGGVMAAWQACRAGRYVVLTHEHDWLGGQLTAQGVPPDEHSLIETAGASASYRAFRAAMRQHYLDQPDFVDRTEMTEGTNPGDGWVSRLCIEPRVAASYLQALLQPFVDRGLLRIIRTAAVVSAWRQERRVEGVVVRAASGVVSIRARYVIDATDTGEVIALAGLPYRLGKEAQSDFGEADAPALAQTADQQPVTQVLALRREASAGPLMAKPEAYDFWCRYLLPHYGYPLFSNRIPGSGRGSSIALPWFGEGQTLDLWRYRRVVSARNWRTPRAEVSLINWAQNDYALQPLLDGGLPEAEVVAHARQLSLSFAYWLQTAAPRPDGGTGYPELQLAGDVLGTSDGLAQQVYVRESRRIVGLDCLNQTDIAYDGGLLTPVNRPDSVGTVWYNIDIHPTCVSGHGTNARARPFTLPLGSFIPAQCDNLIPACKNISVSHLVNAATRVHPAEWLIGEVAGLLAVHALDSGLQPALIHASDARRAEFQSCLTAAGIPLAWDAAQVATRTASTH